MAGKRARAAGKTVRLVHAGLIRTPTASGGHGSHSPNGRQTDILDNHRGNYTSSATPTTMARRTAVVDEFDDDTDIPLPARPLLANPRGPLLEQIGASDDDQSSDDPDEATAGSASQSHPLSAKPPSNTITDITPYKRYAALLERTPRLIPPPDGRAYIQYTSTQSGPMAAASAGLHAKRASGGPSARTSPRLATVWGSARCTK